MLLGLGDGDGVSEGIAGTDKEAHLQLVVHRASGSEERLGGRGLCLPAGAPDLRSADHDGGGAAMVADGNVLVVGQQRVVGAEQPADACGVIDGGVEVGVVADLCRELHGSVAHGDEQTPRCGPASRCPDRRRGARSDADAAPTTTPVRAPSGDSAAVRAQAAMISSGSGASRPWLAQASRSRIWSPMATPMRVRSPMAKDAVRQILNGEVRGRIVG